MKILSDVNVLAELREKGFDVLTKEDLINVYFYGKASAAITKGDVVMFAGAEGDHALLAPATQTAINANPSLVIGIAETDLSFGDFGYVIITGKLLLDTTDYDVGDILWFDSAGTTAGAVTTTEPTGTNAKIQMAAVTRDHITEGRIVIRTTIFSTRVSDIDASGTPSNATFLRGDGAWAQTIASISVGTTAPTSPVDGQMWWDDSDGTLYVYYNDGTSSQWVSAAPSAYFDDIVLKTINGEALEGTGNIVITPATIGAAQDVHTHVEADITDLDKYTQTQVDTLLAGKADASHTHAISDVTGLQTALNEKATPNDISTAIDDLVGLAPGALDTLEELATALGEDPNFATTVTNSLAGKADNTITITGTSGLTGGGDLTANRTISHADTSTQGSVNNSGTTFIQDVTLDGFGHVTGLSSATAVIPTVNDATLTVQGSNGLAGSGTFTANQGTNATITISHADTSSQASVDNSNGTVIQDITLDGSGHVIALGSVNLDGRYYTESEADGRFVNVTGDTMSGNLRIESASFASLILDRGAGTNSSIVEFVNDNGTVGGVGGYANDGLQLRTKDGTQMIIDASNNVGIGTESPVVKLHTISNNTDYQAKFQHDGTTSGYAPGSILLEAGQANSRGQGIYHYNTVADENWFTGVPYAVASKKWIVANQYSASQLVDTAQLQFALLTIDSDTGNVGIGTSSPNQKLEVEGTTRIKRVGINQNADLYYTGGEFFINANNANNASIRGNVRFTASSSTNTIDTLFINGTTGDVGIGTTSPSYILHTKGGTPAVEHTGYAGFEYHNSSGQWEGYVGTESNTGHLRYNSRQGEHTWYSNGVAQMKLTGGNVGIGTTSPNSKFEVFSGTPNTVARFRSSDANTNIALIDNSGVALLNAVGGALTFLTGYDTNIAGGSEKMRIQTDGNIGIGTASPTSPLHIVGNGQYLADYGYNTITLEDTSGYPGINLREGNENWLWRKRGDNGKIEFVYTANASTTGYSEKMSLDTSGNLDVANSVTASTFYGSIATSGNGQTNTPFRLASDYSSYMVAAAGNTWGLFWAGNSGAKYGTNGTGGPGNIWGNSGNPNEFVFVGGDNTKWTVNGNTGDTWQPGSLFLNGQINLQRGGTEFSNYIRSQNYPSQGFTGDNKYWIEYGSKGGHHFVVDSDGGTGGGENTMDNWTIWKGAVDGPILFQVNNDGDVGVAGAPWNYTGYKNLAIGDNASGKTGLLKFRSTYNSGNGAEIYQGTDGTLRFNINGSFNAASFDSSGIARLGQQAEYGVRIAGGLMLKDYANSGATNGRMYFQGDQFYLRAGGEGENDATAGTELNIRRPNGSFSVVWHADNLSKSLTYTLLGSINLTTGTDTLNISPSNGLNSVVVIEAEVFANGAVATWTGPLGEIGSSSTYKSNIYGGSTKYTDYYRNTAGTQIYFSATGTNNVYRARVYELKVA